MTTTNRPTMRATLITACSLAFLASAAACGSGADSSGPISSGSASADSAQALDPCALVDEATIESTLGADVTQEGPAKDELRGRTCSWDVQTADGAGKVVIATYRGSEFYLDGTIGDPISGIADEAQRGPGAVLLRQGDDVAQVEVIAPGLSGQLVPLAKTVADAVNGRRQN